MLHSHRLLRFGLLATCTGALLAASTAASAEPPAAKSTSLPTTKSKPPRPAKSTSATDNEPAATVEQVALLRDGQERVLEGRAIVRAADGGILLETNDGVLWSIERREISSHRQLDQPFKPLTPAALSEKLISEMPAGFKSYSTPHYVICYNTSRTYAQWTGSLLERLYKAFTNYWEGQGLALHDPEFPLPVFVFSSRQMYDQAAHDDLPNGTGTIIGYYSLRSNRINMFDLTGVEAVRASNSRGSMRELNQILSQPAAVPLVATIVHEATHQIAFNCGLQRRYADIPLWQCEGMAVYFERPIFRTRAAGAESAA